MPKVLPRCVMKNRDGSQCSRRVSDASMVPPVCHIHSRQNGGVAVPVDEFDGQKKLRELARSSNEQIALRATDLLLELKRKELAGDCPRCAQALRNGEMDAAFARLTDEQREELTQVIRRFYEILGVQPLYLREPAK